MALQVIWRPIIFDPKVCWIFILRKKGRLYTPLEGMVRYLFGQLVMTLCLLYRSRYPKFHRILHKICLHLSRFIQKSTKIGYQNHRTSWWLMLFSNSKRWLRNNMRIKWKKTWMCLEDNLEGILSIIEVSKRLSNCNELNLL